MTELKLIKLPIELSKENTILFNSKEEREAYFNSLECLVNEDFTYQRENNIIRYLAPYDEVSKYNYVQYINDERIYYAFITDVAYSSDNVSLISIETDTFMTYEFDLEYKQMFVEREHTNNDTIGANTVPENIESGENTINKFDNFGDMIGCAIIVQVSEYLGVVIEGTSKNLINGIYSGLTTIAFSTSSEGIRILNNFLATYENAGKSDAIINMFMFPLAYIPYWQDGMDRLVIQASINPIFRNYTFEFKNNLNGYYPKNNKLFTYPYDYLMCTNNNGLSNVFRRELCDDKNKLIFEIYGALSPGGSFLCVPINYRNGIDTSNSIAGGKFPTCSWNSDTYKNWVARNSNNLANNMVGGFITSALGVGMIISGNPTGISNAISGFQRITSTIASIQDKKVVPPIASGNTNIGDISFSRNLTTFDFYEMSLTPEYARIVDDYFTMYGYKTNRIKLPNIKGRRNFNFVKVIGANIHALINQNDLEKIKNLFENGITIWHNVDNFLDYSKNNDII